MKRTFQTPIGYYDLIAENYDEIFQFCDGNAEMIFKMTSPLLPLMPQGRILDIGCGTGLASLPFAMRGWEVYGIDGAGGMLKVFSRKGFARFAQKVDLEKEDFPFPDVHFDLAISNGVFCHFSHTGKVISEAARVLKPGGIFCFTVENIHKTEPFKIERSRMDIYRHKLETLVGELTTAGFEPPTHNNYTDYRMPIDGAIVVFTALLCRKM